MFNLVPTHSHLEDPGAWPHQAVDGRADIQEG